MNFALRKFQGRQSSHGSKTKSFFPIAAAAARGRGPLGMRQLHIEARESRQLLSATPLLLVSVNQAKVAESAGSAAVTGTVTRSGGPMDAPLDVFFVNSNTVTGATVDQTKVTIAAGQASATFSATPVDDQVVDHAQTVIITATADGYDAGNDSFVVTDDQSILTVAIVSPAGRIFSEAAGDKAATGTISIPMVLEEDLQITLTSSDTSETTLSDSTVTIKAGSTSTAFALNAVGRHRLRRHANRHHHGVGHRFCNEQSAGPEEFGHRDRRRPRTDHHAVDDRGERPPKAATGTVSISEPLAENLTIALVNSDNTEAYAGLVRRHVPSHHQRDDPGRRHLGHLRRQPGRRWHCRRQSNRDDHGSGHRLRVGEGYLDRDGR